MKIAVGSDPNAEDFKQQLIPFIKGLGHEVTDFGSADPIYANVAIQVAENVAAKNLTEVFFSVVQELELCLLQIRLRERMRQLWGMYILLRGRA